jgi:hypothetical protein
LRWLRQTLDSSVRSGIQLWNGYVRSLIHRHLWEHGLTNPHTRGKNKQVKSCILQ